MEVLTHKLPLDDPPRLADAGRGRHGRAQTERYRMPTLWCLHLYEYDADFAIDGRDVAIRPGLVTLVPPGAAMVYRYRHAVNEHFYAHFAASGDGEPATVPEAWPLGAQTRGFREAFEAVIAARATSGRRADALLWTLLWDLSAMPGDAAGSSPGLSREVAEAVAFIDTNLQRRLRVAEIARRVGRSHNHLTRRFRLELGQTVAGFIRRRRVERAQHLLRETDRGVASVASEVGLPDLQQFNKTFRREVGVSPTRWRAELNG